MNAQSRPPIEGISDALAHGEVIPFLGSAASLPEDQSLRWEGGSEDCYPNAKQLASYLAIKGSYPRDDLLSAETASDSVKATEQSQHAGELLDPLHRDEKDDPLPEDPFLPELRKAAQFITLTLGRPRLVRYLDEIFRIRPAVGKLHKYLARLDCPQGQPLIVVTTNYDDLLERAFDEAERKYMLVVHTTGRSRGERLLVRESGTDFREENAKDISRIQGVDAVIYKMHGSIRSDSDEPGEYVITDDDYVDFLARMVRSSAIPALLNEPLKRRSFLFLGYGLEDWNLRVLLSQLAEGQLESEGLRNWAIQKGPSLFDQKYWEKKGVDVYDITIQEFVAELDGSSASEVR